MRKRFISIMLLIVLTLSCTMALAENIGKDMGPPDQNVTGGRIDENTDTTVRQYILPILALVIVTVLTLVFKKSNITKDRILRLLTEIWNIIVDIDNDTSSPNNSHTRASRKQKTLARIEQVIPKKDKSLLEKTFGSLSGAVEMAFQVFKYGRPIIKKIF